MEPQSFVLSSLTLSPNCLDIFTDDDSTIPATYQGSLIGQFSVLSVLYISNLFSVSRIIDHNCIVSFGPISCFVQDCHTRALIGQGHRREGLYIMDLLHLPYTSTITTVHVLLAFSILLL